MIEEVRKITEYRRGGEMKTENKIRLFFKWENIDATRGSKRINLDRECEWYKSIFLLYKVDDYLSDLIFYNGDITIRVFEPLSQKDRWFFKVFAAYSVSFKPQWSKRGLYLEIID